MNITIINDALYEVDETFTLTLTTSDLDVNLENDTTIITITDTDSNSACMHLQVRPFLSPHADVTVGPVNTMFSTSEAEGSVEVCVGVTSGALGADVGVSLTAMNGELITF